MPIETQASKNEEIKKLEKLIQGIKVAMLTTVDESGRIHSRPMATQQIEFNGDLWFFSTQNSHKIAELKRESKVQISYVDEDSHRYVSISGAAQVVKDPDKAKELWSPLYKAWFPEGLNDPNLVLLKVTVDQAEYWDSPSSAVVHLIGLTKAIVQGKPYEGEGADHKKVDLAG
jgi:general stress protein 26